jgi:hypothetical protein
MAGKEVVLDERVIRGMLSQKTATDAFPWMKATTVTIETCGCGGKPKVKKTVPDYMRIKRAFAEGGTQMQLQLKRILGASSITIKYRKADGKMQKVYIK